MKKIPRQAYTAEIKELAVKRVKDGESIVVVVEELGLGVRHCVTGSKRQSKASSKTLAAT